MGASTHNLAKLPSLCYAFLPWKQPGERIVILKAGEAGYYQTDFDGPTLDSDHATALVNKMNARLQVSQPEAEAMLAGSAFGWHVPGADPAQHNHLNGGNKG